MFRVAILALSLCAAAPALAEPITITVQNQAGQILKGIEAYPVSADDGSVLDEHNLGGYFANVAVGASTSFTINADECGLTYFRIGVINETEQAAQLDTCSNLTLVVTE